MIRLSFEDEQIADEVERVITNSCFPAVPVRALLGIHMRLHGDLPGATHYFRVTRCEIRACDLTVNEGCLLGLVLGVQESGCDVGIGGGKSAASWSSWEPWLTAPKS